MRASFVDDQVFPIGCALFKAPYDAYCSDELLVHFRTRKGVLHFPMIDPEEAARAKVDAMLDNRFEFRGETHELGDRPDWLANPSADARWHDLLHTFYYAVGMGAAFRESGDRRYLDKWISLTSSWIEQMPPGFGGDVAARRVRNWIYAYYYFVTHGTGAEICAKFHDRFLASLHDQVEDLIGNPRVPRDHRTLELHAIFLAAVAFPEFARAHAWLDFALDELVYGMETVLRLDGVHSTAYHHLAVRDYVNVRRLAAANKIDVPLRFDRLLEEALEFSLYVHRPDDGMPSLFDGDTQDYRELLRQGHELFGREDMLYVATQGGEGRAPARRAVAFRESGYCVLRSGWGDRGEAYADERYLVFDCGSAVEDQAHVDPLSIELYGYGQPLVVDPGCVHLEDGDPNGAALVRAASSYNTVRIDGRRETREEALNVKKISRQRELGSFLHQAGFDLVRGTAKSWESEVSHERCIAFVAPEYWVICDKLTAVDSHQYDVSFLLSPVAAGRIETTFAAGVQTVQSPHLVIAQVNHGDSTVDIEIGFVSRRNGETTPAPVVRFGRRAKDTIFHTVLYPHRDTAPVVLVRELPVWSGSTRAMQACALSVAVYHDGSWSTDYLFLADGEACGDRRFGNYRFDGTHLLLRKNAYGQVIRLHASPGARLEESGYPVSVEKW
jgi:hypothetical protein